MVEKIEHLHEGVKRQVADAESQAIELAESSFFAT
jgi:hypothetical protein